LASEFTAKLTEARSIPEYPASVGPSFATGAAKLHHLFRSPRFPRRDPEIEAMYPDHLLPSSPQMLEELLRRNLELEQSVIREPLIVVRAA
jgi:hypothetical protein